MYSFSFRPVVSVSPRDRGAFALVVCSLHRFCLITGSEEEHSPVLRALGRSAARKMPSKSLDDISSDSASENKVCPLSYVSPELKNACALFHGLTACWHAPTPQCRCHQETRPCFPECAQTACPSVSETLLLK